MPSAPTGSRGIDPQEAEGRLIRPTASPTACPDLARPFIWPWALYLALYLGPGFMWGFRGGLLLQIKQKIHGHIL